jgi:hypothetical protein
VVEDLTFSAMMEVGGGYCAVYVYYVLYGMGCGLWAVGCGLTVFLFMYWCCAVLSSVLSSVLCCAVLCCAVLCCLLCCAVLCCATV